MAKILIAEDDDSVRAFVERALMMDGHQIECAADGELALERLRSGGRFDLLLSDIKMPAMDGIALAHEAALLCPDMTIVLMTGYADQRERAVELCAIVRDVVLKPFSLAEIRHAIARALEENSAAA